ncbi:hypothetical protein F6P94_14280 [Escherichia coli]|nr:hypothetical protein F6P94_14280 [Escherichia coli]
MADNEGSAFCFWYLRSGSVVRIKPLNTRSAIGRDRPSQNSELTGGHAEVASRQTDSYGMIR